MIGYMCMKSSKSMFVLIRGHEVHPYLLANFGYPLRKNMLRNFKPLDVDLDKQMNGGHIVIENASGFLKGRCAFLNRLDVQ